MSNKNSEKTMIDHEELGEESQELFERGLDKNALHLDIREVPARIYKHDLISKGEHCLRGNYHRRVLRANDGDSLGSRRYKG